MSKESGLVLHAFCCRLLPLVLLTAGLAGCSGTVGPLEPLLSASTADEADVPRHKKIGKPYKVGGRWYTPEADEDYDAVGMASWYGRKFHGKRTANGERFNKGHMTAAHPTLPLPSFVRVTVVETGASEVLRVNDRGPFAKNRLIDVSRAAAEKLGFRRAGSAKVRVEYLGPAPLEGGERETRVAAAKFGKATSRGGFKLNPFSRREATEDGDDTVEVRLAAAEDPRPAPVSVAAALPGVRVPASQRPQEPAQPVRLTATAFRDNQDDGAIDALVALAVEDDPAPAPVEPLPEQAVEASGERVMGAHDLFASLER